MTATLWVAALHQHMAPGAGSDHGAAACAYCSGGYTAATPTRFEPVATLTYVREAQRVPLAPVLRPVLPLSHSGNAPPR